MWNEGKTLSQLEQEARQLGLVVRPEGKKLLKRDYIKALRGRYIVRDFGRGPVPDNLQRRLQVEPMLCFRYKELGLDEQKALWRSADWGFEEKYAGARVILVYHRIEGMEWYGRDLDATYRPVKYDSIGFDLNAVMVPHMSVVMDIEVVCENRNLGVLLFERGITADNQSQAVEALISLPVEDSRRIQSDGNRLSFRALHLLELDSEWLVKHPYRRVRPVTEYVVSQFRSAGLDISISPVALDEGAKRELYLSAIESGLDGAVAKNMDSQYMMSSRRRDGWVKVKKTMAESYGDTVDAFIVGGVSVGGKVIDRVDAAVFLNRPEGRVEHKIATVSNFDIQLSERMTGRDELGRPVLSADYLHRVVELDGVEMDPVNVHLRGARLLGFRDGKFYEDCVFDSALKL